MFDYLICYHRRAEFFFLDEFFKKTSTNKDSLRAVCVIINQNNYF